MADAKTKPSDIAFTVSLSEEDWDYRRKAWRCPALSIPKSEISVLYDENGDRRDKSCFEVIKGPPAVHWIADRRPTAITVEIQLSEQLSLEADTSLWKKISGVLAVVSTIAIALINKGPEYLPWLAKSPPVLSETTDLVGATFHDWGIEEGKNVVSFNLIVAPLDLRKYVKRSIQDDFKLVFALRPRSSEDDMNGEYDYVTEYFFENRDKRTVFLTNDRLLETAANGKCMSMVLFRVSTKGLARVPLKTPFAPRNYGPDIELLQSEGDGRC